MSTSRAAGMILAIATLLAPGLAHGDESLDVPVMIGGDPDSDACGTVGRVSGLNPDGANVLSVRAGPGLSYRRLDVVPPGQLLFICGARGRWMSVVYSKDNADCGVSTPASHEQEYGGPCACGWVFDEYVAPFAG